MSFTGNNFDGTDEILDSRDLTARIAELEDIPVIEREEDEQDELDALYDLQEESSNVFENEESFISDDYFEDYIEEMIKDAGYISQEFPSWIVIDWSETADNLKIDYTSYEFRGTTYWARD